MQVLIWNTIVCFVCLFILTIFNDGSYLTFKSIFHKAFKYGIIADFLRKIGYLRVPNKGTTGTIYNVFGMKRSLTGDWTLNLLHLKPALHMYKGLH